PNWEVYCRGRMGLRLILLLIVFSPGQVLGLGAPFYQVKLAKSQQSSKTPPEACSQEPHRRGQALGARGECEVGLSLLKQGRLREAEEALRSAIRLDPNFGAAHEALGEVFLQGGNTADAKREFTSALQLDPDSVEARFNL